MNGVGVCVAWSPRSPGYMVVSVERAGLCSHFSGGGVVVGLAGFFGGLISMVGWNYRGFLV